MIGQPLYENGLLAGLTGGFLRPGQLTLTARLVSLCRWTAEAWIVEVGCGSGSTLGYLNSLGFSHTVGIDLSRNRLMEGRLQSIHQPLVCGRGQFLPLASGQADVILAECSLTAMLDLDEVLSEFQRVLRPGGCLALSDVYIRNSKGLDAVQTLPVGCGFEGALTQDDLTSHLQAHNFEVCIWEDHSEMLKNLAGQMSQAYGSINCFWAESSPAVDMMDLLIAVSKAKLGYFLLTAQKV